jgi:hypothetical protein
MATLLSIDRALNSTEVMPLPASGPPGTQHLHRPAPLRDVAASRTQHNQPTKVITEGGDLREAQVDVPLSV